MASTHLGPANTHNTAAELLIPHSVDMGDGITVERVLPHRGRRMIGAWCLLDYVKPVAGKNHGLHIGPHPHIGLQTFTWLLAGEIIHRDSIGTTQLLGANQVNLMTTGRGIAHSEDSAEHSQTLHAVQFWIALPESQRHCPPAFHHYPHLPIIEHGGFTLTLLVGSILNQTSPVHVFTPLIAIDIINTSQAQITLALNPIFEYGIFVLSGSVLLDGIEFTASTCAYLSPNRLSLNIRCSQKTHILLLGGEPFEETILMWWNFVGRTREELEEATHQWNHGKHFGMVVGSPSLRLGAPDIPEGRFR